MMRLLDKVTKKLGQPNLRGASAYPPYFSNFPNSFAVMMC